MSSYQPLFDLMYQEHGLTLLESEMQDIIHVVKRMEMDDFEYCEQQEQTGCKCYAQCSKCKRLDI